MVTKPLTAKADTANVESVLDKLSGFEVTGTAATRKENHERLQVDAEHAIRVKAKTKDKVALDVYVGLTKAGNTMVRAEGEDVVLSVRGSIRYVFDKELKMFRDRVVTDVNVEDVKAMAVQSSKGSFRFEQVDNVWRQAASEKPIKDFAADKVRSLASALVRLRATDFAEPGLSDEAAGFTTPSATVTFTKKDDTELTLTLGKAHEGGSDYYARVSDRDTLFRVSKYTAERAIADASAFAKSADDEKPAPTPPDMGHGGAPTELPPELMKQLQQQLQQQGMGN
jgi:hypothetical protein